jgi:hypothetical protein
VHPHIRSRQQRRVQRRAASVGFPVLQNVDLGTRGTRKFESRDGLLKGKGAIARRQTN